jgi:hypothetical protein
MVQNDRSGHLTPAAVQPQAVPFDPAGAVHPEAKLKELRLRLERDTDARVANLKLNQLIDLPGGQRHAERRAIAVVPHRIAPQVIAHTEDGHPFPMQVAHPQRHIHMKRGTFLVTLGGSVYHLPDALGRLHQHSTSSSPAPSTTPSSSHNGRISKS